MNKRGAAELISYVLIIGLSITLAIVVGMWSKGESKRVVETTVKESEIETRCAEVHLGGFGCIRNNNLEIKAVNRGSFSINGIRYICTKDDGSDISGKIDLDNPLKPGEEQSLNNLNNCDSNKEIILTPFIAFGDMNTICPEGEKIIESIEEC
ncbi:hypothetical protein HYV88_02195 [Candidatus Woesearchaeota archaeon]|nr:hypothetical protein [Candidatus Woesearchaeota archaeon]